MIEERHQDFLRFGRPIPPSGEFWFGKNCTLSQNIYLPHLLISIKHQHETIDKKEQGTRFLLLTDSFHSIQMKNPRPHPSKPPHGSFRCVRDPAERRVSIIGYLGITNIGRNNQSCCSTAPIHFISPPRPLFPSSQKIPATTMGQTFVSKKLPHFSSRPISPIPFPALPFQVILENRR
jgi:hypothetical protein